MFNQEGKPVFTGSFPFRLSGLSDKEDYDEKTQRFGKGSGLVL